MAYKVEGWHVVAVVGIIVLYMFMQGGIDLESATGSSINLDSSGTDCTAEYEVGLSGVDSEFTEIANSNGYELILTSSDLNSENTTVLQFQVDSSRVDECRGSDGSLMETVIKYEPQAFEFDNKVDTTDSSSYHTVFFDSSDGKGYNITADGVAWAMENQAKDVVSQSTDGEGVIKLDIEDYTSLDKGVKDDFAKLDLATIQVADHTINVRYLKD